MALIAIGLNHRTAPVHVRERLSVAEARLPELVESLGAMGGVDGAAIVSTCNRVEIFVSAGDEDVIASIVQWLAERGGAERAELEKHLYIRPHGDVANPLFRVAPGLDSMILGEPQIHGQVRAAFLTSQSCGALDPLLTQLFEQRSEERRVGKEC